MMGKVLFSLLSQHHPTKRNGQVKRPARRI
jgi:hypothetical protein